MLKQSTKKLFIFTAAYSLCRLCHAHDANDYPLVPVEPCNWSLGVSALYLQPSFGGNGLGYSSFSNYGFDFFNNLQEVNGAPNYLHNVHPDREWGFKLEGAFAFGAGNDISVEWYHYNNTTHGQLPASTLFSGSASMLYAGALNVEPRWDAVNIEFGQLIDLSDLIELRLHGGLEIARVKTTFTNYPSLTSGGTPLFATTDNISYSGIGPRVGADLGYAVGDFTLYAKAASSLLVGKAKQTVAGYYDLTGFNLYSTGNYTQSNKSVVVPEMEGKLGIQYGLSLANGTLGFDLGYLWLTYLDSLVSQVGSGVVSSSISNSTAANFEMNGLVFGITWKADV